MTAAERLKKIEGEIAELNIRMSGVGGGGGANHNLLSATHPDTDPDSPVRGDILRGIAGPEWQRYALGAAGRFLRSDGNDPVWNTIQAGDLPAHAAEHEVGGGDLVDHDNLLNFVANEHIDWTNTASNLLTTGNITTWGNLLAFKEAASTSCTVKIWSSGAAWHAPVFRFFRGRGTQAIPLAILNNDNICNMPVIGQYDGANTYEGGQILWQAAENWNAANRGITFTIKGTNLGAVTLSDWLTIEDGDSTFGGNVFLPTIKNGATQVAAGAAANELWKTNGHATLPDNVVMIGV